MHEQFANVFYRSASWRRCRRAYVQAHSGLCERCLAKGLIVPGTEVHHIQPLTPDNLDNPAITLSWDNLQLLCKACHDMEHHPQIRWRCDELGHVEL